MMFTIVASNHRELVQQGLQSYDSTFATWQLDGEVVGVEAFWGPGCLSLKDSLSQRSNQGETKQLKLPTWNPLRCANLDSCLLRCVCWLSGLQVFDVHTASEFLQLCSPCSAKVLQIEGDTKFHSLAFHTPTRSIRNFSSKDLRNATSKFEALKPEASP